MIPERKMLKKLGEILVFNEVVTSEQLKLAIEVQRTEGGLLGDVLIKLGYAKERDIVLALTMQYGFPFLPLESYELKKELAEVLPEEMARKYSMVPLDMIGSIFTVAMSDPLNTKAIEEAESKTSKKVQAFISTVSSIYEALDKLYKQG
ncbi:MAG: hypothetical protein PHH49_05385 [Candidatus Omnitrophica bacterium]|nr:hypothetical protein [Candidatus Omnitrophota bacterium]MDD5488375.1 hypothetical protein [Candidatus Omnitrophota bacterium]